MPAASLPHSVSAKRNRHKAQTERSKDDFLAAGVAEEEGGEKWRAGDAQKALRFFQRAIGLYDEGLRKFPKEFNLAYNKARLQFDVCQQPRLWRQLGTPLLELLGEALRSHRVALDLSKDDTDVAFNTAQLLTALGEREGESDDAATIQRAQAHLQEAIALFDDCLGAQERALAVATASPALDANTDPPTPESAAMDVEYSPAPGARGAAPADAEMADAWALVLEPTTAEDAFETAMGALQALVALVDVLPPTPDALAIALRMNCVDGDLAAAAAFFGDRAASHATARGQRRAVRLASARCGAALTELRFHAGAAGVSDYAATLESAFAGLVNDDSGLGRAAAAADAQAEAAAAFDGSVSAAVTAGRADLGLPAPEIAMLRWKLLTSAVAALGAADAAVTKKAAALRDDDDDDDNATPPPPPRHELVGRRGELELLRAALGEGAPAEPAGAHTHPPATRARATLYGNAATYFAGARRLLVADRASASVTLGVRDDAADDDDEEEEDEVQVLEGREAAARALAGETAAWERCVVGGEAGRVLADLLEHELIGAAGVERLRDIGGGGTGGI